MSFFMSLPRNFRVLYFFIHKELILYSKTYVDSLINMAIWPVLGGFVNGYIMPYLGVDRGWGALVMVSTVVFLCFYMAFDDAGVAMVTDMEGDQRIMYDLTLPYSPELITLKIGITMTIRMILMTIMLPFIGKLVLYDQFSLAQFSMGKFLLCYVLSNLVFSFFALMMSCYVRSETVFNFKFRILDPLGFLAGCFLFPWALLYSLWPVAGMIVLINPVVHAMESMRVAFFGQEGYVNYWASCAVLTFYVGVFFYGAVRALHKRLDYVPLNYVPVITKK